MPAVRRGALSRSSCVCQLAKKLDSEAGIVEADHVLFGEEAGAAQGGKSVRCAISGLSIPRPIS